MNYIELESQRLLFRKYHPSDFSVFYDMLSNPENMKYRSSEPKTEQQVLANWLLPGDGHPSTSLHPTPKNI